MSPLDIKILMHYHENSGNCSVAINNSKPMYTLMHTHNLLEETDEGYVLTDRGQFFVDAILTMELPECVWTFPEPEKTF